jgi:hypothetical protein
MLIFFAKDFLIRAFANMVKDKPEEKALKPGRLFFLFA